MLLSELAVNQLKNPPREFPASESFHAVGCALDKSRVLPPLPLAEEQRGSGTTAFRFLCATALASGCPNKETCELITVL